MEREFTRKLVGIMFTDIVGYSRMMGANETHALRLLDKHDDILAEKIASYGGTVLKKMGDSFFASFDSATSAVNCAIEIQQALRRYNEAESPDNRFSIRIGLHMGDVIVHNDDLFGDGINVAARLQPLAKPGGICISDAVYQAVKKSAELDPVRVGEVELKNILERHVIYEFPPFYTTPAPANSTERPTKKPVSDSGFSIERIEKLPPPKAPHHRVWINLTIVLLCIPVGATFPFLLGQIEFDGVGSFVNTLVTAYQNLSLLKKSLYTALFLLPMPLGILAGIAARSVSRRYVFNDIRGIDEWLEWAVMELGWKEPTIRGKALQFKPTFETWWYWGGVRLSIRVDGNSVTAVGPSIFINRLTRTIEATGSAAGQR